MNDFDRISRTCWRRKPERRWPLALRMLAALLRFFGPVRKDG